MDIPKTYRENLAWRQKMLARAGKDKAFRAQCRELFFRDPIFAFNGFFFTLDVRKRPYHNQPFCTYPFQDEAILELVDAIRTGKDVLFEKSRDMGCSWIVILCFLWIWLNPEGGADFLLGSRIEDYVDKKGDMRTLMEKARYAFKKLPRWLWPKGFVKNQHDNFMRLQNPETGAAITGESNNANFSTGGRYVAVLFDEFAKWEGTDTSAWTAAGDATPCRVAVSTAFGAAGQYYELVTDGKTKKVRLHWSLHPEKAAGSYCRWPRTKQEEELGDEEKLVRSPWYDMQCARRRPLEIAQELDIDYIGAGNPAFDGKAGLRILLLQRLTRKITSWWEVDLAERKLKQVEEGRSTEAFMTCFEEKDEDTLYALGVDVVEGVEGGDFAVVKVLNRKTKSVAASYYSQIDEVQLAIVIEAMAKYWKTYDVAWVGIETTGPGLSTFDICALSNVPGLFMMQTFDNAKQTISTKKGWKTTTDGRKKLVSAVKGWLLDGQGWCDARLLREMQTFVRDKFGKPSAKAGSHDDEVFAFGISLMVDELAPFQERSVEVGRREDGLPDTIFKMKKLGEVPSLEERCLVGLLAKKEMERLAMLEDLNDYNDIMFAEV